MLVQHFLNVGPTCWTRLRQYVQYVGQTFRKCNDFIDCLRLCHFSKFFSLAIMADKQMFKALVMVELLDSEEEEEIKIRGMATSWLNKRGKLGYFTNIVRKLQLEDTEGFKEMMRGLRNLSCS